MVTKKQKLIADRQNIKRRKSKLQKIIISQRKIAREEWEHYKTAKKQ